jgi:hypothetical protein
LFPGIEAGESGETIWLRGNTTNPELDRALLKLPLAGRHDVLEGGRLRPFGARIPRGLLPKLDWKPIAQRLHVSMPPAVLPGLIAGKALLRLVRSAREQRPTALLTSLDHWVGFATSAPEIRLRPLVFAVSDTRQVLVKGFPLPAIPGDQFVDHAGVVVPAGFSWSPPVQPKVLRRLFGVSEGGLAIWNPDNTIVLFSAEQFVPATRSAARMSLERSAR